MAKQVKKNPPALTLEGPDIEEFSKRLAIIYRPASISRDPVFSWLQILNDATILGENLRREQREPAASRAAKILMRILEFAGYFLYAHQVRDPAVDFSDLLAPALRAQSLGGPFTGGESISAWVLRKYPDACAKCGGRPCKCCLEPWVIENRREDPEAYYTRYGEANARARSEIDPASRKPFTIGALYRFFADIYANTYYHQEPWKVGMHLSEELGEATIELSRIWLAWGARNCPAHCAPDLEKTFQVAQAKLGRILDKVQPLARDAQALRYDDALAGLQARFEAEDPLDVHTALAAVRFKEEIADSLSWLSALFGRLDPNLESLGHVVSGYTGAGAGDVRHDVCPWCHKPECSNDCLMMHGLSSGIVETVAKF